MHPVSTVIPNILYFFVFLADSSKDKCQLNPYFADLELECISPGKVVLCLNFTDVTLERIQRETKNQKITFQVTIWPSRKWMEFDRPIKRCNRLLCSMDLIAGKEYGFQVEVFKFSSTSRNSIRFLTKTLNHREVFHQSELEQLLIKAKQYRNVSKWLPVRFAYRNKPRSYFTNTTKENDGIMEVYLKDNNGDPGSPINGQIKGLFFAVRPDPVTGEIPDVSPFGDTRVKIPITKLLNVRLKLYFADFYCTNSKNIHYVTLVATECNSPVDNFCKAKLPMVDWYTNPFLRFIKNQGYSRVVCCEEPRIELIYTENINLRIKFVEMQYNIRTLGVGYSTEGGLEKRPNCAICNLYS